MNDKEIPTVGPVEDKLVDEVVSGCWTAPTPRVRSCWARAGC